MDSPTAAQANQTVSETEKRLATMIRAIPGWIRFHLVFLDSKMEEARLAVADALEKELATKLLLPLDECAESHSPATGGAPQKDEAK